MAVIDEITPYPFDPTGAMLANRVTGEQQIISPPNFRDFYFLIPKAAPFFGDSVVITLKDLEGRVRTLVEGVDYYLTHRFVSASRATAKAIYGSITMLDKELAGVVTLTYQTLGGIWTISEQKIAEILANTVRNPRITSWDMTIEMPISFPPIDHEWDLIDMVGATDLVNAIDRITASLNESGGNAITAHIADLQNPHKVSKTQVGLGNVENYAVASDQEAKDGTSNTVYMTALRTRTAIVKIAGDLLAIHSTDKANPHGTTAAQVGLGNVQNYSVATNQEAVAGALNTRYMTPATTKAVMDAFKAGDFAAHVNNKINPHEVDKLQVGLALVENFGMAAPDDARLGTRNDVYMTPLRVRQAIQALAGGDLNTHVLDLQNPHQTTKGQVGLGNVLNYGTADSPQTQLGVATNLYTTPKGVVDAIKALVANDYHEHSINTLNPHQVSAEQVGAYTKQAINTILEGYLAINGKAVNTGKFDNMDIDQYAQYVLAGKAANTALFDGRTPLEFRTWVLQGTASDSDRLGGKTVQEIVAMAAGSNDPSQWSAEQRAHPTVPWSADEPAALWTLIGSLPIPDPTSNPADDTVSHPDGQWLVAGTESSNAVASGLFYVRLCVRKPDGTGYAPKLSVMLMNGVATGATFGWVTNVPGNSIDVYVKTQNERNLMSVTELNKGAGTTEPTDPAEILKVEPASITYATDVDSLATAKQLKALEDLMSEAVRAITNAFTGMVPDVTP